MCDAEQKGYIIHDLKNKYAMIIMSGNCGNETFIGVAQGYTGDGIPYPIGTCAQCMEGMRKLDGEKDIELMMEFRSDRWDEWIAFCLERNYRPCVDN